MKTATKARNNRTHHRQVANYVQGAIKKAMIQTAVPRLRKGFRNLAAHSYTNMKRRTNNLQKGVSRYAHKNPVTTLTLAAITGAVIGAIIANNAKIERTGFFDRLMR